MRNIRFVLLYLSHLVVRIHEKLSWPHFLFALVVVLLLGAILIRTAKFILTGNQVSQGFIGVYQENNLPAPIATLLSSPLVSLDKSGRPEPNLVSGWQVNNNATVYTFKLREGIFWNDGTSLKSSDINFLLPDVSVSYPDERTLEFKLNDSFSPFPTLLTVPLFKNSSLTGVGKFKVVDKEVKNGLITKLRVRAHDLSLPTLVVKFYPDEKLAKIAFQKGEIQSLIGVNDTGELQNETSVRVKKIESFSKVTAVFYNLKDKSLSDKNLRVALGLAIPAIAEENRAKSPIPPDSWAYNSSVKDSIGNEELAKSYLAKARGELSQIVLTTSPYFAAIAETVVESWKKIGISAMVRIESGLPQNFQALLTSQPIPQDPDQYALWHSTQAKTNISKYSAARVDRDLEDGRRSTDLKIRKERYLDFQKVLIDDAPATFLFFPKVNVLYRKNIEEQLFKIINLQFPE